MTKDFDLDDLEDDDIIQILLADGKIFIYPLNVGVISEGEWKIAANANDVFCWNLPFAVHINPKELKSVFNYWQKDYEYGVKVWCIVKEGMMPQRRFALRLKERGIWDLSDYDLLANRYEKNNNLEK